MVDGKRAEAERVVTTLAMKTKDDSHNLLLSHDKYASLTETGERI